MYTFKTLLASGITILESNDDCDVVGSFCTKKELFLSDGLDSCDATEYDDDNEYDNDGASFPKRFNSAQRLGSGAREPLANTTDRHSSDISLITKPGDNRRKTKWHSHSGVDPLQYSPCSTPPPKRYDAGTLHCS